MDNRTAVLAVHAVCVIVIAGCFVLAGTVLRGQPLAAAGVVGVGAWLWGKLGFKPAQVVLDRVLVKQLGVTLDEVQRITSRPAPPAPAPTAPPEVTP